MFGMASRGRSACDAVGSFAFGVILCAWRAASGSRIASDLAYLRIKSALSYSVLCSAFIAYLAAIARLASSRGGRNLLPRTAHRTHIVEQPPRGLMDGHSIPFDLLPGSLVGRWHFPRRRGDLTSPAQEVVTSAVDAVNLCRRRTVSCYSVHTSACIARLFTLRA